MNILVPRASPDPAFQLGWALWAHTEEPHWHHLAGKKRPLNPHEPTFLADSPVLSSGFPFTLWHPPRNSFSRRKAPSLVCAWTVHEPVEIQVSTRQVVPAAAGNDRLSTKERDSQT